MTGSIVISRGGENSTSRSLITAQTWGDRPGQLATNQNKQTKSCLSFHSQPESQFYLSRSNEKRLNGSCMSRQSGPRCNYKNSSWNYSPWQFTFFLFNSSIHSLFPLSSCFEVGQSQTTVPASGEPLNCFLWRSSQSSAASLNMTAIVRPL